MQNGYWKEWVEAPRPSPWAFQRIQEAVSHLSDTSAHIGVRAWMQRYLATHAMRLAHDYDYALAWSPEKGRILKVGAALFALSLALARERELVALDLDPWRFFRAIMEVPRLHICAYNVEESSFFPFRDASFDLVLFNEILEHLRADLIHVFEQIKRVLKPGGALLLSTPNPRSLWGITRFLLQGRTISCGGGIYDEYSKLRSIGHMGHVREYSVRETTEFLYRMGFEVLAVVRRGALPGISGWIIRAIPSLRPFYMIIAHKPSTNIDT